jgi:hypothetical protein
VGIGATVVHAGTGAVGVGVAKTAGIEVGLERADGVGDEEPQPATKPAATMKDNQRTGLRYSIGPRTGVGATATGISSGVG